jgi:hypothetical protein
VEIYELPKELVEFLALLNCVTRNEFQLLRANNCNLLVCQDRIPALVGQNWPIQPVQCERVIMQAAEPDIDPKWLVNDNY